MTFEFQRTISSIGDDQSDDTILRRFRLYETKSKFYVVGRNNSRRSWRVLTIDREEITEINLFEDPNVYTEFECYEQLKRIDEEQKPLDRLKFVTYCYGIIGFVKFLGPYYMLLITKRRQIGTIDGHIIYAINESKMIPFSNSAVQPEMAYAEKRYKKLLCSIDLTKDFFFSYSYHVMRSLQKNVCNEDTEEVNYNVMFVWNEFLTRGIRNLLKNSLWTVALVHGFFKQAKLTVSEKTFNLTLIARRSRLFAGTRFLKRGVNEIGRVANDVETEQIVFEDLPEGCPVQISSIVQHRGSIPLYWSQEPSPLNFKPDIILSNKDDTYKATRFHFDNLVKRYGHPIIILNLVKKREKKPRESKIREEFAHAIETINNDLRGENRLKFIHLDFHDFSRRKGSKRALEHLYETAEKILNLTGFFHAQLKHEIKSEDWSDIKIHAGLSPPQNYLDNHIQEVDSLELSPGKLNHDADGRDSAQLFMLQKGVLRTNCIDCLDRTNVAQYAYGLVALGHQLHALNIIDNPRVSLNDPLAEDLTMIYGAMGDKLALQYGGSPAHNKIFSERRGWRKAAAGAENFLISFQRYFCNTYLDREKQDAINLFLGYYQPQKDKRALWELDSDQHFNLGSEKSRLPFQRSLSLGNIGDVDPSLTAAIVGQRTEANSTSLSEPTQEYSIFEIGSASRPASIISCRQPLDDTPDNPIRIQEGPNRYSNFVDGWFSSAENSDLEEESVKSCDYVNYPILGALPFGDTSDYESNYQGDTPRGSEASYFSGQSSNIQEYNYSSSFQRWVNTGGTLFHYDR